MLIAPALSRPRFPLWILRPICLLWSTKTGESFKTSKRTQASWSPGSHGGNNPLRALAEDNPDVHIAGNVLYRGWRPGRNDARVSISTGRNRGPGSREARPFLA